MYGAITLQTIELQNIIRDAVREGIRDYIAMPKKDVISERQAKKMYPPELIREWLNNGSISYQRNGTKENSRKNFSYTELKRVAFLNNVKERN